MGETERGRKVHEVWKEQSPGTGLQGSIESKNTSVLWQCKAGTSPKEKEVRQRTPQNYGARFRRGFAKQISSTSPVGGHTPQHTSLLTIKLHLAGQEVEAVVNTGASASVVGKYLAHKLGIWKRARKVKVK